jgi:hypothetical protein
MTQKKLPPESTPVTERPVKPEQLKPARRPTEPAEVQGRHKNSGQKDHKGAR